MKHGDILKEELQKRRIKPTEAAEKLGRSSRVSIYNFYRTEVFRDTVLDEIKDAFDIDILALAKEKKSSNGSPGSLLERVNELEARVKVLEQSIGI